jgi:hypothetical protein
MALDPFKQYGFEFGGGGNDALGPFLGAYLAHKTGLIDFNDKDQQKSLSKNGVMGTILRNQINKPQGAVAPYQPPQGGFGANADYSMQPVPPKLPSWTDQSSPAPDNSVPPNPNVVVTPVASAGPEMGGMDMADMGGDFLSGIDSFASFFV